MRKTAYAITSLVFAGCCAAASLGAFGQASFPIANSPFIVHSTDTPNSYSATLDCGYNDEFVTRAAAVGFSILYSAGGWQIWASVDGAAPARKFTTATPQSGQALLQNISLSDANTGNGPHLYRVYLVQPYGVGGYCNPQAILLNDPLPANNALLSAARTSVSLDGSDSRVAVHGVGSFIAFSGSIFEVRFKGTGAEIVTENDNYGYHFVAASTDSGPDRRIEIAQAGGGYGFLNFETVQGLDSRAAHTLCLIDLGPNSTRYFDTTIFLENGTVTTQDVVSGSNVPLSVAAVNPTGSYAYQAGDWITVGHISSGGKREVAQITAVQGNTLTVRALKNAYPAGTAVTNYADPPAAFLAPQPTFGTAGKTMVAVGDSNLAGADGVDGNGIPLPGGDPTFGLYEIRNSFGFRAAQTLGYDPVMLTVQGTAVSNMTARITPAAVLSNYRAANADVVVLYGGINDANNHSTSPEKFQSDYLAFVNAAKTDWPTAKIYCIRLYAPTDQNNLPPYNAAIDAAVASANRGLPQPRFFSIDLTDGPGGTLNVTNVPGPDMHDARHPTVQGHIKLAKNLVQVLQQTAADTTLTGHLTLEGIDAHAAPQNVTFVLTGTATLSTITRTATVSPDGAFSLTGLTPDTYSVRVTAPHCLAVRVANVNALAGTPSFAAFLPAGDANGDDAVDIGDFAVLVNAYNGEANVPGSGYDPNADLNCDGVVDIADFGLLVNNYGRSGDL